MLRFNSAYFPKPGKTGAQQLAEIFGKKLPRFKRVHKERSYTYWADDFYNTINSPLGRLEFVGHGIDRAVYAINEKLVLKLPLHDRGSKSNEREFQIYRDARKKGMHKYLAPTLAMFDSPKGKVLISKRIQGEGKELTDAEEKKLSKVFLKEMGFSIVDLHEDNVTNGIILDYAILDSDRSDEYYDESGE